MTLSEIEKTIANLPPDQLAEFRAWFESFYAGEGTEAYQHDENMPLTPELKAELNWRMDALEAGLLPPGEPWEKVKEWLKSQ